MVAVTAITDDNIRPTRAMANGADRQTNGRPLTRYTWPELAREVLVGSRCSPSSTVGQRRVVSRDHHVFMGKH